MQHKKLISEIIRTGVSQTQLAKDLAANSRTVRSWISGECSPNSLYYDSIIRLHDYYCKGFNFNSKQYKGFEVVIFDADNTLRETVSGKVAPQDKSDWRLLDGVSEWRKDNLNVNIAIASNQGGVALGFVSIYNAREALYALADALYIDRRAVFACYSHPDSNSRFRKPNAGMLKLAAQFYGVELSECLMVGDMESDMMAAENGGCGFEWAGDFFGRDNLVSVA